MRTVGICDLCSLRFSPLPCLGQVPLGQMQPGPPGSKVLNLYGSGAADGNLFGLLNKAGGGLPIFLRNGQSHSCWVDLRQEMDKVACFCQLKSLLDVDGRGL